MSNPAAKALPSDQTQREHALNPANSILVQAPAGSGKTDLLTRRFLRLLAEVEDPAEIVAITFTKAAAAEMRHRILSKLEQAALQPDSSVGDEFSMETLARRALMHAQALGWNLLDQPAQLRISTIDSFCRDIALQQPLLSGLGDGLGIYEHPDELYRRAARRTLEQIDSADPALRAALESLLDWRDNNWHELETLLAAMLASRDRWIHDFVLGHQQDWDALRAQLERPFVNAIREALDRVSRLLDQLPDAREEALALARFAFANGAEAQLGELAELAEFPSLYGIDVELSVEALGDASRAHSLLAGFVLTNSNEFRKTVNKTQGFPADRKTEKERFLALIGRLREVQELEPALAQIRKLPPVHYSEDEWQILRACFTLLRHAAAELQIAFAEAGAVDYIEVAQIAQSVLKDEDELPSDAALALASRIHHILVDEFQDTSRRQHHLLRALIAAWPDRIDRSCFVVGDPMQSIYFFRDADAELFPRVQAAGLEIPGSEALLFESVRLTDNFRTAPTLVNTLNEILGAVFAENDGRGVTFAEAKPARHGDSELSSRFKLHLSFTPKPSRNGQESADATSLETIPDNPHVEEIVTLIRSHLDRMEQARAEGMPYRLAVLGRTRAVLAPIAEALRRAAVPFRAVDLEQLSARPEVLDALSLARAILSPFDRVAWLSVLRAPWCGLSLSDLHKLTSNDDTASLTRAVPDLLTERLSSLTQEGQSAVARLLDTLAVVPELRFTGPTASLGTWLQRVWQHLGGAQCADAAARANLDLLWQSLDKLPNGEQDLLGTALDAALRSLTAQPDPAAESECGVQLMTIHKSKGLEFEVVILPELQAGTRKGQFKMLSWLERGLPPGQLPYESDEVTEFLVAPMQSKGSERGIAQTWVDRVYGERESQEMRRLVYVAATRARDELHIFARPACKQSDAGEWELSTTAASLLAAAWPGLKPEIERQFAAWKERMAQNEPEDATLESIAAAEESNLLVMPARVAHTLLRRLPADFRRYSDCERIGASARTVVGIGNESLYERHEGGLLTRTLGIAVHSLLEEIARLREKCNWDETRLELAKSQSHSVAQIRSAGVEWRQADQIARQAMEIALDATRDSIGQWILSPHAGAAREVRWAGVINGELRAVQVDRVFRAGSTAMSDGGDCWWIVDYKTAHADDLNSSGPETVLPALRAQFAQQLNTYAEVLRKLHGDDAQIKAGLFYPRMLLFDCWEI